jgi:hypothetical protein
VPGQGDLAAAAAPHGRRALDAFRTVLLPRAEVLPGFCSARLLVDRLTGRSALAVALRQPRGAGSGRSAGRQLRAEVVRRLSASCWTSSSWTWPSRTCVPETV